MQRNTIGTSSFKKIDDAGIESVVTDSIVGAIVTSMIGVIVGTNVGSTVGAIMAEYDELP